MTSRRFVIRYKPFGGAFCFHVQMFTHLPIYQLCTSEYCNLDTINRENLAVCSFESCVVFKCGDIHFIIILCFIAVILNVRCGAQIVNHLITYFSTSSCYVILSCFSKTALLDKCASNVSTVQGAK